MYPPFVGDRKPLDEFDIPMLAHRLDVGEDELRAFLEVEARSRGFDREGRPIMLFEPHVFYRNLSGAERDKAVAKGLAYKNWGEKKYPTDSYPRLEDAVKINESAALKACSIGLSQVLVENHSSVGYATPQDMWSAFMDDEQEHVEAMVRFILVNGIADDLKAHRWHAVARVYNGPKYRKHNYHGRMAAAYKKFAAQKDVEWQPDGLAEGAAGIPKHELKQIQQQLRDLGYVEAGKADGVWGTKTRAAVLAFRADNNLPLVATIDDEFKATLIGAHPRLIAKERAEATVADVRKEGSRTIKAADQTEVVGGLLAAGGVGKVVADATGQLDSLKGLLDGVQPIIDTAMDMGPYILIGLGAFVVWQMWKAKQARVEDHRNATHAGKA